MSSFYTRKAALESLKMVTDGLRYADFPTREVVDEWLGMLRTTETVLRALQPLLPTRDDLAEEERKADEAIGRSISTAEIPQ